MARRPRHPDKEVEAAIADAEALGWRVKMQGHWGRLYCPHADRSGCQIGIWSTPRNAGVHARQIRHRVDQCPHRKDEDHDRI